LIRRGLDDEATRTDRDRLLTALAEIDALYESGLEPHRGVGFVTHHDAWRRLTGRFGVRVVGVIRPIETSEPTPGAIAAAVDAVRSAEASLIIVEPQFDPGAARRVAELTGAPVATLDPLGDGDWFAMMRANLEALTDALGNPSDLGASGGD
ncbi:MAG: metal ABC transporter substrate-binding protein, partial [Planctomycetota bacterium]